MAADGRSRTGALVVTLLPAVAGGLWWVTGHPRRGAVLIAVAVAVALARVAGVPVDRFVARLARAASTALAAAVSWSVGGLIMVLSWPARLLGRDVLRRTWRTRSTETGWYRAPQGIATDPTRMYTSERGAGIGRRRTRTARAFSTVTRAVGAIVLLMAADVGVGWSWERVAGPTPPTTIAERINVTGSDDVADDPRADLPAMADAPWADALFDESARTSSEYWPFTETKPLPFSGQYVNIDGWSRRTYRPAGLDADAPTIWFFGGSTAWGVAQRDEHTIASSIARLAEQAGVDLEVVNYGQRGWAHFQEMILFEHLLATDDAPDLAIFYDGINEFPTQVPPYTGSPSHMFASSMAAALRAAGSAAAPESPNVLVEGWRAYRRHSAARKLLDAVVGDEAGASVGQGDANYPEEAVDVYRRGRAMTMSLAASHQVETVFLWQPAVGSSWQHWAGRRVGAPTVDISDALDDHLEVYVDGGHTNEAGAAIVAERIWTTIEPLVGRLRTGAATDTTTTTAARPVDSTAAPPGSAPDLPMATVDEFRSTATRIIATSAGDFCTLFELALHISAIPRPASAAEARTLASALTDYVRALAGAAPADLAGAAASMAASAAEMDEFVATAPDDGSVNVVEDGPYSRPDFQAALATMLDTGDQLCSSGTPAPS